MWAGGRQLLKLNVGRSIALDIQGRWGLVLFLGSILLCGSVCFKANCASAASFQATNDSGKRTVLIVRGASGAAEYGQLFDAWSDRWEAAATQGGAECFRVGPGERKSDSTTAEAGRQVDSDRIFIEQTLRSAAAQARSGELSEFWIVMMGHGTFDGRSARFNLRGQDISSKELAKWLKPVSCPVAIANCSSASGPFLKALSGPNRIVITATKSGAENNFSRFGEYLSAAVGDPAFDLDKDGQTSLFEAYLSASRRTESFYETEGRLATEHALLDDNGDGLGVRADFFRGIRVAKNAKGEATVDGRLAHQFHLVRSESEQQLSPESRHQRDRLELSVIQLRDRKATFDDEDVYYAQMEELLVQLAEVYESSSSTQPVRTAR